MPSTASQRESRKVKTVVFTDMAGFTQMQDELGERLAKEITQQHTELARTVLRQYSDGELIKEMGDGLILAFEVPSHAARFALRLQKALPTFSRQVQRPIQDRIAIHVGEMLVESYPDLDRIKDLHGIHVSICSRVQTLCKPGHILLTHAAFDSAWRNLKGETGDMGELNCQDHGFIKFKGIEDPVRVYEIAELGETEIVELEIGGKAERLAEPGSGALPATASLWGRAKRQMRAHWRGAVIGAAIAVAGVSLVIALPLGRIFTGLGHDLADWVRPDAQRTEMRKAALSLYSEARGFMDQNKLTNALEKISYAIGLQPATAEYHFVKGNILQCLLRLQEARAAYAVALKHSPQHGLAQKNLKLCEELLLDQTGKTNLPPVATQKLRLALLDQGRDAQAATINVRIDQIDPSLIDTWRNKLSVAGIQGNFRRTSDGGLELDLKNSTITDLGILRGMIFTRLNISYTSVSDLTPLRGMPLLTLDVQSTNVRDLRPLQGMRLKSLHLGKTKVNDLGPLRGMPLLYLMPMFLGGLKDLSPLQGMPLKYLNLYGCSRVSDLSPLKGMELDRLDVDSTQIRDLAPLAGMPLIGLNLGGTRVSDLSALTGIKTLESLRLSRVPSVTNLSALKGLPLTELLLDSTQIRDLTPLRGMPLKKVQLHKCDKLKDISPLAECPELEKLSLPPAPQAIDFLRQLPKLQRVTYTLPADEKWEEVQSATEFWRAHNIR